MEEPKFDYVMFSRTLFAGKSGPVHLKKPDHPFTLCGVRRTTKSPEYAALVGEVTE